MIKDCHDHIEPTPAANTETPGIGPIPDDRACCILSDNAYNIQHNLYSGSGGEVDASSAAASI